MEIIDTQRRTYSEQSLTLPEFHQLVSSIHESLALLDILTVCCNALTARFPVSRITLVQDRPGRPRVTLYPMDLCQSAEAGVSELITLPVSRLLRCLENMEGAEILFSSGSDQDSMETSRLAGPDTALLVYLPLETKGTSKGVLVIALEENVLGSEGRYFLTLLAEQLAIAIQNSDLHYAERRRGHQLRIITEIASRAAFLENLEDFFNTATKFIHDKLDYTRVQILGLEPNQELLQLRASSPAEPTPRPHRRAAHPLVEECRRQGRALCRMNPPTAEQTVPGHGDTTPSQLAAPILLRGKFIGVLWIESDRINAFRDDDLKLMEAIASLVASAFDTMREVGHAQQSNEYMRALFEAVKDIAILSTDVHGYVLTCSAGSEAVFHRPMQDIIGRDLLTLFTDLTLQQELPRYMARPAMARLERTKVTQQHNQGQYYLDVAVQRVHDLDQRPLGYVCIARNVTENVELNEKLEAQSITDELTGLLNQRSFFSTLKSEIERARRYHHDLALCFFDLDGFKKFNDTNGHLLGSEVLKATAKLLDGLVRSKSDTRYRYGGDEFIVIMPETNARTAMVVAERIRFQLYERFEHQISASFGIAGYSPGLDAQKMVFMADEAMYAAKEKGGNCIVVAE